jgi:hypothetical protein
MSTTVNLNKRQYHLLAEVRKKLTVKLGRDVSDQEALEMALTSYFDARRPPL